MDVYLGRKKIRLDPSQAIGKGGEADVYRIDDVTALKVFKPPDHPDYRDALHEQEGARQRLAEHQDKLRLFPTGLPERVIAPVQLAIDGFGETVGYTMRFLAGAEVLFRYADKNFRKGGVDNNQVVTLFRDLHATVSALHQQHVVIGDFNDLNVLILDQAGYFIDADSFQFGRFFSRAFTARFVDPLRCDPAQSHLVLNRPHTATSDWYAFTIMLMQCLLFVSPFGGVYRPKNPADRLPHDARPLHRISVFHPEVVYPKPSLPLNCLPDDLLEFFRHTFAEGRRGEFPVKLVESLRWTRCPKCGAEHARPCCPTCARAVRQPAITVSKQARAKYLFRTDGVILFGVVQGGSLRWLYHEDDQFKREDGTVVSHGGLDPHLRYRIRGAETVIGKDDTVAILKCGAPAQRWHVDRFGSLPMFDANERYRYWLFGGRLQRDGPFGAEFIGDVLEGQTLFWAGDRFGFGFYRAGDLSVAFVFDTERPGLNDNVRLPPIRGQIVDATCRFTQERCWFFFAARESGRTVNRCLIIRADGRIDAQAEAWEGDGSWLGTLGGKCAAGNFLLAATDEGLTRVEPDQGQVVQTKQFPDAEPFVDTSCHLFPGPEGLFVVSQNEIRLLQMS
jgi:hypothetical protein